MFIKLVMTFQNFGDEFEKLVINLGGIGTYLFNENNMRFQILQNMAMMLHVHCSTVCDTKLKKHTASTHQCI